MRLKSGASVFAGRLTHTLGGRQLIVVSNREPRVHETDCSGEIVERRPVSGLVTALDPVLRAVGGTWIARASGSADRAVVNSTDQVQIDAPGGYTLRRIWLTRAEERGHYDGLSNAGLWPLCHLAFERPRFRRSDWLHYEAVNRRFADAVVAEAVAPNPVVFVHDYHFALLPRLVRERLPQATIACFWHIPWPNRTRFARCPCGDAIVEAMLGADLLGFQTTEHAVHFLDRAAELPGAVTDSVEGRVTIEGSTTRVGAFPISVEFPSRWAPSAPAPCVCRLEVCRELDIAPEAPLVLSVDRLDYTKGIEERLTVIRRLLARGADDAPRPVFVQVAAPSRTGVESYRSYGARVRDHAAALNERFAEDGYRPMRLIERPLEPDEVFRLYRAADVCHVNSLDDGMNLVAKEFVTARDDDRGVLVLSRFTGAARELDDAILVNPYDVDGGADAIGEALRMPAAEQAVRMRAMRARVRDHDVFHWAEAMLTTAALERQTVPQTLTVFPI